MNIKLLFIAVALLLCSGAAFAQDDPEDYRAVLWKKFNKHNFHLVDFSASRISGNKLKAIGDEDEYNLRLLRGVVFGKRGRVFNERFIQDYLEAQRWYKPNLNFSNAMLTPRERETLDMIRLAEAERHGVIEPGDMRIWKNKPIGDENLRTYSGAELTILIAEVEAIHGKTFPNEEWLQRYFDDRYWYKRNPNYTPAMLSDIDRRNIERLVAERSNGRNTAISIGDMENFQNAPLTEDKLAGLTMLELRLLREEFWARRGKKLDIPGVAQYFEWREWYDPEKDQSKVRLSPMEELNVAVIEAYETKMRERLSAEPLTDDTLGDLFAEDLRVLRNEIYARRGRVFKDPELQKYFAAQPWYKPDPEFRDEMLSEIESENLKKIRKAEEVAISKFVLVEG